MARAPLGLLPVPFREAIEAATDRGVVPAATYYGELRAAARGAAFTVSFVATLRQIAAVLDAATDALRTGGTLADFARDVAAGGVPLGMAHRETVFRNAVQTAYGRGRRLQQLANAAARPVLLYDAINDSRTRPTHRAMQGFMAPVGDPVWRRWTPPCGHRCRCTVRSLTEAQARLRGFTGATPPAPAEPDEGWGGDPADAAGLMSSLRASGVGVLAREALAAVPALIRRAAGRYLINAARTDPDGPG